MKTLSLIILLACAGCTTFRAILPNGTEIIYRRGATDARAERAELYYEDPNTVLWIVLSDPNSSVHPGRVVVPPYFIIESETVKE